MNLQKSLFRVTGRCVLPRRVMAMATVVIDMATGLIVEVTDAVANTDLRVSDDCTIFPGFVDTHDHCREDKSGKHLRKEDFVTAGKAAINGGVVHVCDMANNPEPPVDDASFLAKNELTKKSPVGVTLYAGIGPETHPLTFRVVYKIFLGPSTQSLTFPPLEAAGVKLREYRGCVVAVHPDDPIIIAASKDEPTHERRRPASSEVKAIKFAVQAKNECGLEEVSICHSSTQEGTEFLAREKLCMGHRISVEATPHHQYWDWTMLTDQNRKKLRMNPPLRGPADRLAIINGLRTGAIDRLATDHAPHTPEDKDFNGPEATGDSGVTQLDTVGPFVAWLHHKHNFTQHTIAQVCSVNPGLFLNRFLPKEEYGNGYGQIASGFMGSLTVLNLKRPVTVTGKMLQTKCGWSPFEGETLPGSVEYTIVRGRVYEPLMR